MVSDMPPPAQDIGVCVCVKTIVISEMNAKTELGDSTSLLFYF